MRQTRPKARREPTIALINIVFLMLVFFMVAGTLTQPLDGDVSLINTQDLDGRAPPNALVIHADGRMSYRGNPVEGMTAHVQALSEEDRQKLRVVPDQALPALELVRLSNEARRAGAQSVFVVTERGLQ